MAEDESSKQLECQSTTEIGTASSEKATASIREVDAEQHLEQEDNDPEPPWEWTWACVRNRLEKDLWSVLRNHPLFGIKLVKKNDSFSRWERVFGLLGFVGLQIAIQGSIRNTKLFDQAYCDCIRGDISMEGFSDMAVCNYEGLSEEPPYYNFSLPIDGSEFKYDWGYYYWASGHNIYPVETCEGFQEVRWANKDWVKKTQCGPTKYCCYAYTVSKLFPRSGFEAIRRAKDVIPAFSPNSPCYSAVVSLLVSSIYATLASYSFFNPLVKSLLHKESKKWNPLAYFLILGQMFWGVYWTVVNANRSKDLAENDPFRAAASLVGSILLSLFVTSVIVGLLLQSVVMPLVKKYLMPLVKKYCCCCCKKKPQETTKQSETHHNPEENEQSQKTANLSKTNVELEKQETAKQSETYDDPEEREQPQKTGKQSEAHVDLEVQKQTHQTIAQSGTHDDSEEPERGGGI